MGGRLPRGIELVVVKLAQATRGFVLLPKRGIVERSFAWATRFRRLAKDDERLPEVVKGCISLRLPALCSSNSSMSQPKVHNRLEDEPIPRAISLFTPQALHHAR